MEAASTRSMQKKIKRLPFPRLQCEHPNPGTHHNAAPQTGVKGEMGDLHNFTEGPGNGFWTHKCIDRMFLCRCHVRETVSFPLGCIAAPVHGQWPCGGDWDLSLIILVMLQFGFSLQETQELHTPDPATREMTEVGELDLWSVSTKPPCLYNSGPGVLSAGSNTGSPIVSVSCAPECVCSHSQRYISSPSWPQQ